MSNRMPSAVCYICPEKKKGQGFKLMLFFYWHCITKKHGERCLFWIKYQQRVRKFEIDVATK